MPEAATPSSCRALVEAVRELPGVVAILLGGSHATGFAHAESDVDLVLCYRESSPFDPQAVHAAALPIIDSTELEVAGFGVWGPWMDGGAWVRIEGQRVDLIWRSVNHYERVVRAALGGHHETHFGQQGPFGYWSGFALGEILHGKLLWGEGQWLGELRTGLQPLPDSFARRVVADALHEAGFFLRAFAAKAVASGDPLTIQGNLARAAWRLRMVLLFRLGTLPIGDAHARALLSRASATMDDARRIEAALGEAVRAPHSARAALEELCSELAREWGVADGPVLP